MALVYLNSATVRISPGPGRKPNFPDFSAAEPGAQTATRHRSAVARDDALEPVPSVLVLKIPRSAHNAQDE